jgi:hypothetical protein
MANRNSVTIKQQLHTHILLLQAPGNLCNQLSVSMILPYSKNYSPPSSMVRCLWF